MSLQPDPAVQRARTRTQIVLLLMTIDLLVLAIASVAAVDLRRLGTPGGTALRWVEAAVFGDCDAYLRYSVPAGDVPDTRSNEELCRDLRAATAQARVDAFTIGIHLGPVARDGEDATVAVVLTRDGEPTELSVHLSHRTDTWRVVRDAATCGSVGCA